MLPRKNFENLHTAMAILVLFEQVLGKVCHNFGIFFAQFQLCVLKTTKAYCYEEV